MNSFADVFAILTTQPVEDGKLPVLGLINGTMQCIGQACNPYEAAGMLMQQFNIACAGVDTVKLDDHPRVFYLLKAGTPTQ